MTTIREVKRAVCEHFGLTNEELTGDCRSRVVSRPRQMAYLLCRQMTGLSSTNIARHMGRNDHKTVTMGGGLALARIAADPEWQAHYDAIRGRLQ